VNVLITCVFVCCDLKFMSKLVLQLIFGILGILLLTFVLSDFSSMFLAF